jgi:hypothetical protein
MQRAAMIILAAATFIAPAQPVFAAVDSYRFFHVTIETPWFIFLFLLPIVLAPFLLMAFLYWRFANRDKSERPDE